MEAQTSETRPRNLNWLWGVGLIILGGMFLVGQTVSWSLDDWMPVYIFAGIGLTFFAVYLTNRERRWALTVAYVIWAIIGGVSLDLMLSYGGLLHALHRYEDAFISSYLAIVFSIPFLRLYVRNPSRWWALIVPGLMVAVAGAVTLDELISYGGVLYFLRPYEDAIISTYIMTGLSIPFLYLYARNPSRWWALLMPYLGLMVVGGITLEALFSHGGLLYAFHRHDDEIMGAFFSFAMALPFFYIYLRAPKDRWWALIPGGILASVSVGFLVAGLVALIPILMIAIGAYLLARQVIFRRQLEPAAPLTGPEADKPQV